MFEDIKNKDVSYFAKTNFREEGKLFGIYQKDRLLHTYILGKTGVGKTNLLTTLILQDIIHGRSVCVFDVHGDLIHTILEHLPLQRKHDLLFLDIPNPKMDYRYNPLKKVSYEKRSLVVSGILDTFKKLWKGAWGVKLEHILRYVLLTLLDQERADFTDIPRLIHDSAYRQRCMAHIVNDDVRSFWDNEFEKYTKNDLIPILNKVGAFLESLNIIDTPSFASDADVSTDGNTLYVADNNSLQIIDITDVSSPVTLGSYTGSNMQSVVVSDDQNTAYIPNENTGLLVLDISDPTNPTLIATYNTPGSARQITLSADENTAYLSDTGAGGSLIILDVSNPSAPALISSNTSSTSLQKTILSSDGNTLFAGDNNGLQIFDITNSATPTLIGSLTLPRAIWEVELSTDENTLYAANTDDGLAIIDISNPITPLLISNYDTTAGVGVALSPDGTRVYLADQGTKVEIIDVTTSATPTLIGEFDATIHNVMISDDGTTMYLMNGTNGVTILNVPDNSNIYSTNKPFLSPNSGHVFASTLSSFTETLGSGNQGSVTYQVSTDNGNIWQYWNGIAWTVTTQTDGTETSTANDINTNITTLDTDGGQFLWRAYLESDGTQQVELDAIELDGTFLDVTLTNPTTDIDVINQGWFPITTEVTCDSSDDCGDIELTLDPIGDFFFERTEAGGEEDCITDNVCIARADFDFGIHNSVTEFSFDFFQAPADTQWTENACGADPTVHTYNNWIDVIGGGFNPSGSIGVPMCVHLITDDIYIDIEFASWNNFGTGFSYYRSTTGKGIIPTTPTQPFYTNELSNPITVNLDAGETHQETFWVYADGTVGDSFDFFTYATPVGLPDFRQESARHEITLIAPVVNNDPTDIALDNNTIPELEPTGTVIGNLSTTDADGGDTHSYSLSCVNAGTNDMDFQILGSELQVSSSLPFGTYNICVVSYDNRGGIVEQNFNIILEEDTSSDSGSSSSGGSSVRYVCKDESATNYDAFGRHKQSLCEYKSEPLATPVITPTESNPFNGEQCPAQLIINDNMKQGDRDGQYSSYNQGTVTQVHLLQTHMNRLLLDEYGNQASGPVDGIFGPLTKRGVERLQNRLNKLLPDMTPLDIDGIVGPFTKAAINMSC